MQKTIEAELIIPFLFFKHLIHLKDKFLNFREEQAIEIIHRLSYSGFKSLYFRKSQTSLFSSTHSIKNKKCTVNFKHDPSSDFMKIVCMDNYTLSVLLYEGGLSSLHINQAHSFRLSSSEYQCYFKDHVMWWLKRGEIEHH